MNNPFTTLINKPKPYIMAHRGNQVACPENTLAAFKKALDDGASIIETDLQLTADNVFVCIHDSTIDRTTDGTGKVSEMDLQKLKSFSASFGREEFRQEKVPTLAEVAAILPYDVVLALELKSESFKELPVCKKLAGELKELGIHDRTIILSYSLPRLKAMRSASPDIVTGLISLFNPFPYFFPQLMGPFWVLMLINPFYAWLAHKRGQSVCPFDPNPDKHLRLYQFLKCDAILTNDPGQTGKLINQQNNRKKTKNNNESNN